MCIRDRLYASRPPGVRYRAEAARMASCVWGRASPVSYTHLDVDKRQGYSTEVPKACPACGSRLMRYSGVGTQKVLHPRVPRNGSSDGFSDNNNAKSKKSIPKKKVNY